VASVLKFTGKERDAESGLDYFGARYMSAAQGRFTSPDEPLIDQYPGDPQSWNLYSYVRNNPLNAIDPSGQDCVYINDNSVDLERGNCSKKNGTYVNGTIDAKSFTYNPQKGTLGYSYTNNGALGTGVIAGVYPSRSEVTSGDLFNAVARGTQMAAPGVNLAAAGLQAFGYIVAPLAMTAAQCGAGACSKGDVAMAMVPELGPILEGAKVLKAARVIQYERAGGFLQATKDFESLAGAEKTIGAVKVKELSDGSKAVLRNFSSEGRPTLEIQNAVGKDIKIRYNQ
jgi:RHS repeat-associated protein